MIKTIITDVDGVIVGDKTGVNFPLPNEIVIQKLREIRKRNIPVVLCTGKFSFAIEEIIIRAELDNPHITDGGALIYNPLRNQIIKQHIIDKNLAKKIVQLCIENNIYVEVYTSKDYFAQKNQVNKLTDKRIIILQKEHKIVDSLTDLISDIDTIKILAFIKDESHKSQIENLLKPFTNDINTIWSTVTFMLPAMAKLITVKGVSKKHASEEVMRNLNISFDDVLGIGDLPADWNFMNLCKYTATVGDIDQELRKKVKSKGEKNYLLAPSVDKNGILDIINYFI